MKRIIPYLFRGKGKTEKEREKEIERLGGKDKQDNALWFCCGKKRQKKGKKWRRWRTGCKPFLSFLNICTWCLALSKRDDVNRIDFPPNKQQKKQSLLCRGVKQSYPPPHSLSSLTISQRASFWDERWREKGQGKKWLQGKSIFLRQLQTDHLVQLKLITIIRLNSAMYHQMHSHNNDCNNNEAPRYLRIQSWLNYEKLKWI